VSEWAGAGGATLGIDGPRDVAHDCRHPDNDMSRSGLNRGGPKRFCGLDVYPQKIFDGSSMLKNPEKCTQWTERHGLHGQKLS
jgi:hypothetical protein